MSIEVLSLTSSVGFGRSVGGGFVGLIHCLVFGFFTRPNWQTHSAKGSSLVLWSTQVENSGQYIPSHGL